MFSDLATPILLLDLNCLDANIAQMQAACDAHGIELRPHIKTHKMVEVARRQLHAGAAGLTCAKLSEAAAMLPAFEGHNGKRAVFVAHSLVDPNQAQRLRLLSENLDELVVACTSEAHAPALEDLLAKAGLTLPVMMALDSGLGREGARGTEGAVRLAQLIERQPHLQLHGFYAHEGHFYGVAPGEADAALILAHGGIVATCAAVRAATGRDDLRLWPGCSVSAARVAALAGVHAVRPGAYVFGDLFLSEITGVMPASRVALSVLATVIDRPETGLALLDCGSKTLSSDRTAVGVFARALDGRALQVTRVSEEHAFVAGHDVDELRVGERLRWMPAHVCPVVNLADSVMVVRGEEVVDCWKVDARGCVQ